jgi:trimethylamine--corrinoid protein Co-methyltransferase
MLPYKVNILSKEIIQQILEEALALLRDPGIQVHNRDGLTLLAEAGAQVDFDRQIVSIQEELVLKALESTPSNFYLFNLDGQPGVFYGGNSVHFDPGSTAVTILEDNTGIQRQPVTADLVKFVQLVETLPQLDAQSTAFVCRDVPEEIGDLYRLYLALLYMRKPIVTGAFSKDTWWTMWEMLTIVAQGESELADKPLAIFDVCPTPPLLWSDLTCQNLIDCGRKSVPVELVSMPLAGTTSPVTLSAAVVQHTAESLSGITIHQVAHPGAPIVWGGAPAAFNMREGTTPMGDANTWLIDMAYVQIGKHLGLPTHTYMGSSDAKLLDYQAGAESAGGTILAAFSGVNMVSGAGMIDFLRCQSFEKLVCDAEIIGMTKRLLQGIEIRDTPIAVDLMRGSPHQANFLGHPHTHKWFREELYMPSTIIERSSVESWQLNGSMDTYQRASERIDSLLEAYQPSPLADDIRAELASITTRQAKKFGMERLPSIPNADD